MAGEQYSYRYPNPASYALLQASGTSWQGRTLRHGYIYGYKAVGPDAAEGRSWVDNFSNLSSRFRRIDFTNYKMFQFNPVALSLNATVALTEGGDVVADGGNLGNPTVGLASSSLELFFDRTEEIARANNGHGPEIWRDLGVQQDLFEFFKVISGGDTSNLGGFTESTTEEGTVQSGSMNHLTGKLFDSAVAGSNLLFRPFAVVFNPNLTMHVNRMTSFAFTYLRFTSNLVPTTVKLEIGLEIFNIGTKSYATSGGIAGPVAGGQQNPPGTTPAESFTPIVVSF
jgi:hypothetical protein